VYCKDSNRSGEYPERSFDFLGYTFRPRLSSNHHGERFVAFIPAVGKNPAKGCGSVCAVGDCIAGTTLNWRKIAAWVRPVLTGWVRYYGRF
jgi:RNA-directed DNA polymerase